MNGQYINKSIRTTCQECGDEFMRDETKKKICDSCQAIIKSEEIKESEAENA